MIIKKESCPLRQCNSCLESICPLWYQSKPFFSGCLLKTIVWATGDMLKPAIAEYNEIQQNTKEVWKQMFACPSINLDGELYDILIEDNTRIMEITNRLRECESRDDLKKFAVEEAHKDFPGIRILN